MSMTKKYFWLPLFFLLALVSLASARSRPPRPADGEGILVGHISHVEGQLLRYVSEESDWVATVKDAPFGLDDALYSDENSKAEFIIPNDTWIRTGASTQIQLIALKHDVTEADMASGVARFYNRSGHGVIKVTTDFGYVIAGRESTFDLYVGDESIEVITLKGRVDFIHQGNQAKYEVIAGTSLVADGSKVQSAEAKVDAVWESWNVDRDRIWRKWQEGAGNSGRYLPPTLRDEAYVLEENGRWEEVRYEGRSRRFWRPTSVAVGWSPFTAGRWTVYHGDNTWIPDEQFGYVTHHYGNWVYTGSVWYWAPPVVSVQVGIGPFLAVGLGWYPGRVGWIHTGVEIGWVPLAWNEPYYAYRRWGSRTTVINTTNINRININIGSYRYLDSAIVVNQDRLYSASNYSGLRLANFSRDAITRDFRAAPVVSDGVIGNFRAIKERHNFSNVDVERKPHGMVRSRILRNEKLSLQGRKGSAEAFLQKALKTTTRQIQPVHVAKVQGGKGHAEKREASVKHEQKGPEFRQEKGGKQEQSAGPGRIEQTGGPGGKAHEKRPHEEKRGHDK